MTPGQLAALADELEALASYLDRAHTRALSPLRGGVAQRDLQKRGRRVALEARRALVTLRLYLEELHRWETGESSAPEPVPIWEGGDEDDGEVSFW